MYGTNSLCVEYVSARISWVGCMNASAVHPDSFANVFATHVLVPTSTANGYVVVSSSCQVLR